MEKINNLKRLFDKEKIDGYIIPKNDHFFGEYVSDFNDRLKYISNFSGSFGFALILKKQRYLFIDGRYSLQAQRESGRYFKIITIPKKMPKNILKNKKLVIGFDPRIFKRQWLNTFFKTNYCKFKQLENNLVDQIWKRKVKNHKKKFYLLPNHSVDKNYKFKVNKIVNILKTKKADYLFITASENNAWLLNIRGSDTIYSPIPHSYILLDRNKNIKFFCDLNKVPSSFKKKFKNTKFFEINRAEEILSNINKKKFILDKNTCSLHFENIILKNNYILSLDDPIYDLKAIKSEREIKNIKDAHIYDGIALTKYLFWIKKNFNKKKITEVSASHKLLKFREKSKNFKFSSFPTISGTGPNGAIIHYRATNETNKILKKGDIYLVDSGGQYEFGTTDVTRTISLNNSSERIKNIFTRVLKGHIAVSNFKFNKNTSGSKIDHKARKYLKQIGLDYSHGTGHGVGYFLNVHEGPQAISKNNKIKFQKGMVVSNEPGYYEKGKFGIRIENLVYVKKVKNKKYFEDLTMAPIDKELINRAMLSSNERKWLNNYHRKVYENLKSGMNGDDLLDLKLACLAI